MWYSVNCGIRTMQTRSVVLKQKIVLPLEPDYKPVMTLGVLPGFTGNEPYDLLCGQCKEVIGEGVSLTSCRKLLYCPTQLVIRCKCGAHNRLPSALDR